MGIRKTLIYRNSFRIPFRIYTRTRGKVIKSRKRLITVRIEFNSPVI